MLRYLKLLICAVLVASCFQLLAQQRNITELKEGWKFRKVYIHLHIKKDFDDSQWQNVTHSARLGRYMARLIKKWTNRWWPLRKTAKKWPQKKQAAPGALPHIGQAWYRNYFTVPGFTKGKKSVVAVRWGHERTKGVCKRAKSR